MPFEDKMKVVNYWSTRVVDVGLILWCPRGFNPFSWSLSLCISQMIRLSRSQLSDFCLISEAVRSNSEISISQERLRSSCHSFWNLYLACFLWGFHIVHIAVKDCYRCRFFGLFSDKCLLHEKAENNWDKRPKVGLNERVTLSLIWTFGSSSHRHSIVPGWPQGYDTPSNVGNSCVSSAVGEFNSDVNYIPDKQTLFLCNCIAFYVLTEDCGQYAVERGKISAYSWR